MHVFVYCTVKSFLDIGVSDHKRSGRPRMLYMPQVITLLGQELTEILSKNKKMGKWILHLEP